MNKKDYASLKKFWDEVAKEDKPNEYKLKFVSDEKFNSVFDNYLKDNSSILDYGCGSGWASFDLSFSKKAKEIISIDTSENFIDSAKKSAEISNINKIKFINSDEAYLKNRTNYFDFAMSFNVLDVVPDEITNSILESIRSSLKRGGIFFVGINHDFSIDELTNKLQMNRNDHYFYKNGILRCNKKSINEWKDLFSKYFEVLDSFFFTVNDREKDYPRTGFVLKRS